MLKIVGLIFSLVFISYSHADLTDQIKIDQSQYEKQQEQIVEGGLSKKIKDRLQRTTYSIHLDILDFASSSGLNLDINLPYKIQPSYLDNYYTRVEKYVFGAGVDVDKLWESLEKIMGVSGNGRIEMEFARQFDNFEDAWNVVEYPPYTPKHIPLTSKAAIEELKEFDFFGMKANLAVEFVPLRGNWAHAALSANIHGRILYRGEVLIHVIKLTNNKVRVKLIALKTNGPELKAEVKVKPSITSFGWNPLNNLFERLGSLDLLEASQAGLSKVNLPPQKDGLLMADYIFDLNNQDARDAYDDLFGKFYIYRDGKINVGLIKEGFDVIDPFEQDLNTSKRYLKMNLEKVDSIYQQDMHLAEQCNEEQTSVGDIKCPRISRYIAIQNESESNTTFYKWGADPVFSRESKKTYSKNKISYRDDQNTLKHINHILYEDSKQNKNWFGTFKNATIKSLDILCETAEDFKECNFHGLGVRLELTNTDYDSEDHKLILGYLKDTFPERIYNSIPLGEWAVERDRKNAYVGLRIFFKKEAFNLTTSFGGPKPDIKGMLKEYVKQKEPFMPQYLSNYSDISNPDFNTPATQDPTLKYEEDINLVSSKLGIAFDDTKYDGERVAALVDLQGNEFFQKFGAGFVISILSAESVNELLYAKLMMTSADSKTKVNWYTGKADNIKVFKSFIYMQSQMSNRSIDPRIHNQLFDEVDKTKNKKVPSK